MELIQNSSSQLKKFYGNVMQQMENDRLNLRDIRIFDNIVNEWSINIFDDEFDFI